MARLKDSIIGKTALARFVTKIRQKFLPLSGGTVTGNLTVNGTVTAKGGVELYGSTPFIDFHYASSTADYTSRIAEYSRGVLNINSVLYVSSSGQVAVGGVGFDQSFSTAGAMSVGTSDDGSWSLFLQGGISQNPRSGSATYHIYKDGNADFAGNVQAQKFIQSSDRRMKKKVRDVRRDDTDRAREVRLVEFVFRKGKDKARRYGVIAQEVEAAGLGSLVSEDIHGMKAVDYTALLCLKVRMLERRVEALESGVPEAQPATVKSGDGRLPGWLPWRLPGRKEARR